MGFCIAGDFMWHLRCLCERTARKLPGLSEVFGFWHYLRVLFIAFHTAELPWIWISAKLGSSLCWPPMAITSTNTTFRMHNKKSFAVRG